MMQRVSIAKAIQLHQITESTSPVSVNRRPALGVKADCQSRLCDPMSGTTGQTSEKTLNLLSGITHSPAKEPHEFLWDLMVHPEVQCFHKS